MARTFRSGIAVLLVAALAISFAVLSPPVSAQQQGSSTYIAPTANTSIPVYDTAWQMFGRATVEQADEYFAELADRGFSGAWAAVISHAPLTYNHGYPGEGNIGSFTNGEIVLSDGYIAHVNATLDRAHAHGMRVGLVVAWQNLYLPGGGSDAHVPASDLVRETLTTENADAYGRQMVEAFGSHPAVNAWVFGGDAGTNNTAANIEVWDIMADAIRDEGSTIDIGIHLPPFEFNSLLYADVDFLDFAAPEIGHNKSPEVAQQQMEAAVAAYDIPVWMGEARYFNNDFQWLPPQHRNPGAIEMAEDAQASKNAGVSGYLYGDAGRWNWCAGYGDTTPCDPTNITASFGPGEDAALAVFQNETPPPTTTTTTTTAAPPVTTTTTTTTVAPTTPTQPTPTTTTTTTPPATTPPTTVTTPPAGNPPVPPPVICDGRVATIFGTAGDDLLMGTAGPDVIAGLQGDDIIWGFGGDDVICGGRGNDIIAGGQGFDILFGAQGDDVIYSTHGQGDTANSNLDDSRGARIFAGAGNDIVIGSNRWDRMQGGPGADHLMGFAGNDWMRGGTGNDTIDGGGGNDDIYGGGGGDLIDADHLDGNVRGGPGSDTCSDVFGSADWRGCTTLTDTNPPAPTLPWGNDWIG